MKIQSYNITIGNATDVGKVREQNEDYMAHFDTAFGYCVVLCDGMGGHNAGDKASQNAASAIKYFLQDEKNADVSIPTALKNAIEFANYQLREMAAQNPELKGMGTTCVLALIKGKELFAAHAGDSRLYLIRNKKIKQITKDHSTVQNLVDSGALTEKEAELSDKKNQITKAIGIFEKVNPTVTQTAIPLLYNDKILMCSDGLTGHVNNKSINEIVNATDDVQSASMQLLEKANIGGGYDNITVQIIHYTGKSSVVKKKQLLKKYAITSILIISIVAVCSWVYKKQKKQPQSKNTISTTNKDSVPHKKNPQKDTNN